jgi:hypothetical protein
VIDGRAPIKPGAAASGRRACAKRDSISVTASGRPFLRIIAMVFDERTHSEGAARSSGSRTI